MAAECGSFFTIALGAIAFALAALANTFALALAFVADGFFGAAEAAVEATSAAEATSVAEATEADIVMSPRGSPPFIFVRVLKSNYHQ